MEYTRVEIRDDTYDALAALRTKAFESQEGAALDLSLSDVIDALLGISDNTKPEAEVLETIVITAEEGIRRRHATA